jgi:hypothetical protein
MLPQGTGLTPEEEKRFAELVADGATEAEAAARVCSDLLHGTYGAKRRALASVHATVRRVLELVAPGDGRDVG